jgi:antirestriction protein ArdC
VSDTEGIDFTFEEVKLQPNEKIERCEQVINNYPHAPKYVFEDLIVAYYSPILDFINMPPIEYHDD